MGCGVLDDLKEERFSAEYIRSRLLYDPATGILTWLTPAKKGKDRPGDRAGYALGGKYWRVCLDGEHFYGHRLAWVITTGRWPQGQVDHKDLDGLNNRWENLREATRQQNTVNSEAYKTNALGIKGVRLVKTGKFVAEISTNNNTYYLGTFNTAEEAQEAYVEAAKKLHGEFARVE